MIEMKPQELSMRDRLVALFGRLTVVNDAAFAEFAISSGVPFEALEAYTTLMEMVDSGDVVMEREVDATGKTVGGSYSLKGG